jgi:hypothetical protein
VPEWESVQHQKMGGRVRGEEKRLFTPLPSGERRANTGLNYFKSAETRSLLCPGQLWSQTALQGFNAF